MNLAGDIRLSHQSIARIGEEVGPVLGVLAAKARAARVRNTLLRSVNPFQNYVDADKAMANSIIQNAKYLMK